MHAATTYYISSAGLDANNGTSKATSWAHHPFMPTFTGAYAHAGGDRFVFRGGDTWGSNNFQMHILVGGASLAAPDYYGVDATWFSGGSFARPKFDFQRAVYGNDLAGAGIYVDGNGTPGPITFDNLEILNHRAAVNNAFCSASLMLNGWDNVTVTNCFIHDWDLSATPTGGGDNDTQGGVTLAQGATSNNIVTHCTIGCDSNVVSMVTGACVRNIQIVDNCDLYGAVQGVEGGGALIHDCTIRNFPTPSDNTQHGNGIHVFAPFTIYNVTMHDLSGFQAPFFLSPDYITNGAPSTNYLYNCAGWNLGGQTSISLYAVNGTNMAFRIWNNTISADNSWVVGITSNATCYAGVTMQNNQWITTAVPVAPTGACVTSLVQDHNLTQTPAQAAAAGYVIANGFAPTSASSPTVNIGTALAAFSTDILGVTRPQLGVWDIGAYEFAGGGAIPIVIQIGPLKYSGNVKLQIH